MPSLARGDFHIKAHLLIGLIHWGNWKHIRVVLPEFQMRCYSAWTKSANTLSENCRLLLFVTGKVDSNQLVIGSLFTAMSGKKCSNLTWPTCPQCQLHVSSHQQWNKWSCSTLIKSFDLHTIFDSSATKMTKLLANVALDAVKINWDLSVGLIDMVYQS